MGDSRISNALRSLAGGLEQVAFVRQREDEKAEERGWQQHVMDSQNAFAERINQIRMEHDTSMQERGFSHAETMQQEGFAHQETMFDKQSAQQMKMFGMEQAAANARHAQSLAVSWANLKQQASQIASANEDRKLQRQLGVYELQMKQGQTQFNSAMDAMQKEMAKLSENPALQYDKTGKREAMEKSISEKYAPIMKESKDMMASALSDYSQAVGIKPDFGDVQGGVNLDTGGMRDKVTAMSDAAMAQIGSGPVPPEQNLIAGFMKQGATRTEALAAARNVRSRLTQR